MTKLQVAVVFLVASASGVEAQAQSHHMHHTGGFSSYGTGIGTTGTGITTGAVSNWGFFAPVFVPVFVAPTPVWTGGFNQAGPMPPNRWMPRPAPVRRTVKRDDPEKARELTTIGDRLFRAGNTKRASDRYAQAVRANAHSAAPRVRLSQVELQRGRFAEAAQHLRDAQAAEPGWVINAPDIEAIYLEPRDFANQIAKLESHLQANPNDRDAWLVLGAEWYLTGRTQKAADVFTRLTDREPDATLAAFIEASTPRQPEEN